MDERYTIGYDNYHRLCIIQKTKCVRLIRLSKFFHQLGNATGRSFALQKIHFCDMDTDCIIATPSGCNKIKVQNSSVRTRSLLDKLGLYGLEIFCRRRPP